MYKAKCDGDEGIKHVPKIKTDRRKGYCLTKTYFVDSSGFGQEGEPALTFPNFLKQVKKGHYYGIIEAGMFQVHINEYQKTKDMELFELFDKILERRGVN